MILTIRPWRLMAATALATFSALSLPIELFRPQPGPEGLSVELVDHGGRSNGELSSGGTWQLRSGNRLFGGYSGLALRANGHLAAYSDRGSLLIFSPPDGGQAFSRQTYLPDYHRPWSGNDIEAAAVDQATGTTWIALELSNAVRRYDRLGRLTGIHEPAAMTDWAKNGGPESLVRLSDGRFIAIAESASWRHPLRRAALLFPGDPIERDDPVRFWFEPPIGYDPSDAAVLPDGRVIILLRALTLAFPPFSSKLLIADPRAIAPGEPWPWRELSTVDDLAPRDNYEGLAVAAESGTVTLWLISDANESRWLQRTLLTKLVWKERPVAGGPPGTLRRPRPPS